MAKAFASQADLEEKKVTFTQLSESAWAYTAEGDPNSGVIIGDDGVLIVDTTATPAMAQDLIAKIRSVTDKPIKYVVLSHYHAVRVLGASAYKAQGIVASAETHRLIEERGQQDWDSEYGRFPRLFQDAQSIPGLTWPTLTFEGEMSIYLGKRQVRLMQLGAGHTSGDIVAWVPDAQVMFSGDLIEYHSACYCGDAHLREWPATLNEIRGQCRQTVVLIIREPVIDHDILTLDIACFLQSETERCQKLRVFAGCTTAEKSDHRNCRLLRTRR